MNVDSLKAQLKNIAKEKEITFNQIWKQLLLERFLSRLAQSKYQDKFIFKGGLLLATYLEIGRETTDIDFSLTNIKGDAENIKAAIHEIIEVPINDFMTFEWDRMEVLTQPHMEYDGFRVFLNTIAFGKLQDKIHIDIGLGDLVIPLEKNFYPFEYKGIPIFVGEITLQVYPIETIFSEKLESIISKGAINSRMKDYHDLLLMIREPKLINVPKLNKTIHATFTHRNTGLAFPIQFDDTGVNTLQKYWEKHLNGLGIYKNKLNLPDQITMVIAEINQWLSSKELLQIS